MTELSSLSEPSRALALERYEFLQPHLEDNAPLTVLAAQAKIPYRTAHRWLTLYRKSGLAALAPRPRGDRGKRRKISDELRRAIEGLALHSPPVPVSVIHRKISELAKQRNEHVPCYTVVNEVISQIPDYAK